MLFGAWKCCLIFGPASLKAASWLWILSVLPPSTCDLGSLSMHQLKTPTGRCLAAPKVFEAMGTEAMQSFRHCLARAGRRNMQAQMYSQNNVDKFAGQNMQAVMCKCRQLRIASFPHRLKTLFVCCFLRVALAPYYESCPLSSWLDVCRSIASR